MISLQLQLDSPSDWAKDDDPANISNQLDFDEQCLDSEINNVANLDISDAQLYQNRGSGSSTASRVKWNGYKKNISPDIAQQFTAGMYLDGDVWIKPNGIPYESGMMKV
nr:pectinesterase-like [Ipomoea trifida]